MNTPPLAKYQERFIDSQQTVELFQDHVVATGHYDFFSRYKITTPLHRIDLPPVRVWVHKKNFMVYLGILIASGVLFLLIISSRNGPLLLLTPFGIVVQLFLYPSLWLSILSFQRAERACFKASDGRALLDIAKAGPDADNFEAFIEILEEAVKRNKKIEQVDLPKGLSVPG